jgi:hypothetical protein
LDAIAPLQVADGVLALTVTGVHEPAVLSEHVDALGRKMLDVDADVAIVDLSQLGEPSTERAAAIFSADEMARMLGAVCIFSGIEPHWRAPAESARIALDTMEIVPSFRAAIALANELREHRAQPAAPKWRLLLGRLGRQRPGGARK